MMKSVLPCNDIELIKNILGQDNIYESLAYDGSPPLAQFNPQGIWVLLLEEEAIAGLINLEPINNIMWNSHVYIYPTFRGNSSEKWGQLTAQYMRKNIKNIKIVGFTPYIEAKKWAEKMGFKCIAVLNNSIKKNGKLLNQWLLELGENE